MHEYALGSVEVTFCCSRDVASSKSLVSSLDALSPELSTGAQPSPAQRDARAGAAQPGTAGQRWGEKPVPRTVSRPLVTSDAGTNPVAQMS